jgi:AcrR family transcriptional regulator
MLHVGIGVYHQSRGAERVPAVKCLMFLHGLAASPVDDGELDGSAAFAAAAAAIAGWEQLDAGSAGDPAAGIRAVARAEFARRGYDATTVRDIAAAAGISTGSVYQLISSKDALLAGVMHDYSIKVTEGWRHVLASPSSSLEKLDALMWFNINVMSRHYEEFRIQSAWIRENPPSSADLETTLRAQLRQLKRLLSDGVRAGDFIEERTPLDLRARCLYAVSWTPENVVRDVGTTAALALARDTIVRGATLPAYEAAGA